VHRALLCAALVALAACTTTLASAPAAPPTPAPAAGAVIPLGINHGNKPGYHLTIGAGGAAVRDVLLDTGSSGLWLYPNAIGKYRTTTIAVENSYGSGLHYTGVLVYTRIDFGNGLTTGDVPVALVTDATCKKGRTCPATPGSTYCPTVKPGKNAGIECLETGRKLYGTFGAALATIPAPSGAPVDELYNPIFAIAHSWAHAFEIRPGQLVVGPEPPGGYAIMHLAPESGAPKPLPNGARGWNRDVQVCYTIATLSHRCVKSLFDTGASNVSFQANVTFPMVQSRCGPHVKPGTPFAAETEGGATIASFDAGSLTNWNQIVTKPPKHGPQVNTGMTFFNRNAIYYDAEGGIVGIRPLAKPAHVAESGCGSDSL
jgi:hypothetical protein